MRLERLLTLKTHLLHNLQWWARSGFHSFLHFLQLFADFSMLWGGLRSGGREPGSVTHALTKLMRVKMQNVLNKIAKICPAIEIGIPEINYAFQWC